MTTLFPHPLLSSSRSSAGQRWLNSRQLPHFRFTAPSSVAFPSSTSDGFGGRGNCFEGLRLCKDDNVKRCGSLGTVSAVKHVVGSLTNTKGLQFAVVVARFNEVVTKLLLEGALDTFRRYSVADDDVDVYWVPGSFEIPVVANQLGKSGAYSAVLCIGAVIRGDTTHYDAVANSAASGVLSASLNSGVPCIFGVLTCNDMDQAMNRAGGKAGNKGAEAALTAIEMASLFEQHLKR